MLVVERALRDEGYAHLLLAGDLEARFRAEALGMHRRTTGLVSLAGRLQLPWPRALGTPPWAVAGQLAPSRGPAGRPLGLAAQGRCSTGSSPRSSAARPSRSSSAAGGSPGTSSSSSAPTPAG